MLLRLTIWLLMALYGRLSACPAESAAVDADIVAECIYMLRDVQARQTAASGP